VKSLILWFLLCLGVAAEPVRSVYFDCLPRDFQVSLAEGAGWRPLPRNSNNGVDIPPQSRNLRFQLSRQGYCSLELSLPEELWKNHPQARWPVRLNQILSLQPQVVQATFCTDPSGAGIYLLLPGGQKEYLGLTGRPVPLNLARLTGGSAQGLFVLEFCHPGCRPVQVPIASYTLSSQFSRWPAQGTLPLPRSYPPALWLTALLVPLGLWLRRCRGRAVGGKGLAMLGDYQLQQQIGWGASGKVFRAQHRSGGPARALKILHSHLADDPAHLRAFRQEAVLLSQLDHPHLVRVFEWGEDLGRPYLVMELVEGSDLRTALTVDPLGAACLGRLLAQATAGLAYAHAHGVIHRDIKPENLLITPAGQACWVDFGLAEIAPQNHHDTSGTAGYLAPERLAGHPASAASDQYSLGVLAYEALTGQLPVPGCRLLDQRPGLNPQLAEIVERMLNLDPNHRFPSLDELERILYRLDL